MGAGGATNWIWTTDWNLQDRATPRLICFRRTADFPRKAERMRLRVSADTRYKLYINGAFVQDGPSKGDRSLWYADSLDAAPYLRQGENVFSVEVLRYPVEGTAGNHSMFRTEHPGLYVEGSVCFDDGTSETFITDETWRCHVNRITELYAEETRFAPLMIHEHAAGDPNAFRWKEPEFDDNAWPFARAYRTGELPAAISPAGLSPRAVPLPYRTPRAFVSVRGEDWSAFLRNGTPITVPPHSERVAAFDAGEEMNGFLSLSLCGGGGADIELLESECYTIPTDAGNVKGNRLDAERGILEGYADTYGVLGAGTPDAPEIYEPYFYRTFRFARLRVRTAAEPLTVLRFSYEETGYPLNVGTEVATSDKSLSDIWNISLRTLKRCMRETYMDCPFYERLQYVMDTRSQILYTYAVSADDRLARQAIDDFSRSQRPDGLLNASYPNMNPNVIPGFSVYYILMVHDHMMWFGDKSLVRRALPTVDRILNFFDSHLTAAGLVDRVGGVNGKAAFWSFIDWAAPWMDTEGMPPAGLSEPITMESLLYLMGLQKAAELADYVSRRDTAEEYRVRAGALRQAILQNCVNASGMITDAPGVAQISQHCQVFGVLTGVLTQEEGRRNLLETLERPEQYAQCTVAMRFYLFRALERTGLYSYTDRCWDVWRKMVDNGCTTCVEAENYARSECHAWGALALYELPCVTLGVRPIAPGYGKIEIRPVPGYLDSASGVVRTPRGEIRVSWTKAPDGLKLSYSCPDELRPLIIISESE